MKTGLKEKSKLLALIWVAYAAIEMVTPAFRRRNGVLGFFMLLIVWAKRVILSLLIIANVFMTLSFIDDDKDKV